jgi:hypothetical protein
VISDKQEKFLSFPRQRFFKGEPLNCLPACLWPLSNPPPTPKWHAERCWQS